MLVRPPPDAPESAFASDAPSLAHRGVWIVLRFKKDSLCKRESLRV